MLELESGSNDPMAYMLTLLLIQIIQTPAGETNLWYSFLMFIVQMSVGAVAGFLLGKMAVWLMNRLNIGNQSLYPILLLACVFFIFSITELVKGNGYLAVYIAGLVVGNHKIQHKKSVTTFFDGFTWLFQIVMFLTLGLLVNPRDLLPIAGLGLLVGFFMIILARPISVFLCLAPFRQMSTKAKVYVSWVGLRGAVPIIFATYPLIAQIPYAAAMDGTFPRVFKKENKKGTPNVSLIVTSAVMQLTMIFVYFASNAWNTMLTITSVMILPPYLLWKICAKKQYPENMPVKFHFAFFCGVAGSLFALWMIYSAGLSYLMMAFIFLLVGIPVFVWARRNYLDDNPEEQDRRMFTKAEAIGAVIVVVVALISLITMAAKSPAVEKHFHKWAKWPVAEAKAIEHDIEKL